MAPRTGLSPAKRWTDAATIEATLRARPMRPRWLRALTLLIGAALLVSFSALRCAYRVPLGDGLDGAYYFQIARHVAHGQGLNTSYSVFHMGLWPLPQPATTYPLLPLLLGYLARVITLEHAAVWLPGAAYVLSVGLCFAFLLWVTARSLPRSSAWLRLILSSAITVWFGLIPDYVWTSTRPYTETLGAVLVLATLWAFGLCSGIPFRASGQRAAAFFGVGLLGGLCYSSRFQLVVVGVALVLSRAMARDRRALRDAACIALGLVPCLGWQAWRLFSLPHGQAVALLDFAAYRQLPSLPRFSYDLHFDSRWAWLIDKLQGVLISLDPRSEEAYLVQMSFAVWLVPLGALLLVLRQGLRTRRERWRALRCDGLRRPRHAALLASAWLGLLGVAPIHTVHSLHWRSWAFAWRQGLPLVFVIIPAALWLWSRERLVLRGLVVLAFAASLVVCAQKTRELVEHRVSPKPFQAYAEVATYLDAHAPTTGTLGIEHQGLGVFTDAPLYWLACWSPPSFATTLVRELPIERILLRHGELGCPSLAGIRSRLKHEQDFFAHFPLSLYRIER